MTSLLLIMALLGADPTIRVKDTGNPKSNRQGLHLAIMNARNGPGTRTIIIPHGFVTDRPELLWGGRVDVRGDRPGAVVKCEACSPVFVLGMVDSPSCQDGTLPPGPRPWSASHVVDAFGKLDLSIAPAPGVWSGMATFGSDGLPDTVYTCLASPFTGPLGGSWEDLRSFSYSMAYEADASTPIGYQVCGISRGPDALPYNIRTVTMMDGNPGHEVHFQAGGKDRWFMVRERNPGGVRRFTFSIDLDAGLIFAWSGGFQEVIDGRGLGDDFVAGSGMKFADSDLSGMKWGGLGEVVDAWQDSFGGPAKYTFYGTRISSPAPFGTGDGGQQTIAATGQAATDADCLARGNSANLVAALDGTAPPSDSRFFRWVTAKPNSISGWGMALLAGSHTHPYNGGTSAVMSDMDLQSGSPDDASLFPYGPGIWVNTSLQGYRFERMRFAGGRNGFEGLIAGAIYPVMFRDIKLRGGTGRAFISNMMTATFEGRTHVEYPGREGMRFVRGTNTIRSVFMSEASAKCMTYMHLDRGGRLTLEDGTFDTEYAASPTVACFLASRGVVGDQPSTRLSVSDTIVDGGAAGVPLFKLDDAAALRETEPFFMGEVWANGVTQWHPERGPTFDTNGPGWAGEIKGHAAPVTRTHTATYGPPGEILGVD